MGPMNAQTPHAERGFMPDKLKQFENDLDALHTLLKKAKAPLTAQQIKKALGCSKQAVYFRLRALKEDRHVALCTTKVREGAHGPNSKAYSLAH